MVTVFAVPESPTNNTGFPFSQNVSRSQLERTRLDARFPREPLPLIEVEHVLVQRILRKLRRGETFAFEALVPGLRFDELVEPVAVLHAEFLNHRGAHGPRQAKDERCLEHGLVHDGALFREKALEHVAALADEVQVRLRDRLRERLPDDFAFDAFEAVLDARLHVLFEHQRQNRLLALDLAVDLSLDRPGVQPLPDVRLVVQVLRVDVHHTTARHRRGGGVLQVRHLEQKLDVIHETHAFAVGQREKLVVVHHRVHVLDPHRVDVAVEDDVPRLVRVRRQRFRQRPEDVR
eukprot:30935-Pelagococcus_subviridis.AAC.12